MAERIDEAHSQDIGSDVFIYETTNSKKKKVKGKIDTSISVTLNRASEDRERFISFVNSTQHLMGAFIMIV